MFTLEEEDSTNLTMVPEFLAKMSPLANRAKYGVVSGDLTMI